MYAPLLGTGYPAGSPWEGHQVPTEPAKGQPPRRTQRRSAQHRDRSSPCLRSRRAAPAPLKPKPHSCIVPEPCLAHPWEGRQFPEVPRSGSQGPPPRRTRRRFAGFIGRPSNSSWPEMESSCDVTSSDMGQGECQCFVCVPMRRHHALLAVCEYDSAHLATTNAEARKIPIKCSPGHGL